jgi:hypothetical protein
MSTRIFRLGLWLAAAFIVHVLAGRELAGRDVLQTILEAHHRQHDETILFLAALTAARVFLYFVAPWWALHIVVVGTLQAYRAWREKHGPLGII